jgi:hypothetical protein
MRSWITNHYLVAKVAWSLLIHDFPSSTAQKWDDLLKSYYRRWLGLAKSAEAGILYRSTEHFGLKLKCLNNMQEQLQVIRWHLLKTSSDEKSKDLYTRRLKLDRQGHVGTGRINSPCMVLEDFERRVVLDETTSKGQTGRHGLGLTKKKRLLMREKVVNAMKKEAEDQRVLASYKYEMQTNWVEYALALDVVERKDLTWQKILSYTPNLLKFTLNALCNTLPSPDNLRRWKQATDLCCGLCSSSGATLSHILCGCPWVNTVEMKFDRESRFKWRHDCIVSTLVTAIRKRVTKVNSLPRATSKPPGIKFVRAGQSKATDSKDKAKEQRHAGLLERGRDWKVLCDLSWERSPGSSFVFPSHIATTSLKPDIIVYSPSSKFCIVGPELTAPMEENIASWKSKKLTKYSTELTDNLEPDWNIHISTIEVGARGWIPPSFYTELRRVFGFSKRALKELADTCSHIARKCSYVIWINRFNKDFIPFPMVVESSNRPSAPTI